MTIIAFASQHGGVGVTTSALTIAFAFARQGHETLLLDLHPQGHCGLGLGLDGAHSVYDWLVGNRPALSLAVATHIYGPLLLRGDSYNYKVEKHYNDLPRGIPTLVDKIRKVAPDRWVIIDSPRGSILGTAVLTAADVIVIPFRGDSASLHGLYATKAIIDKHNTKAEVIFLPTLIDLRQRLSRDILDEVSRRYGDQVAQSIPQRIAVAEAAAFGQTIWDFSTLSAEDVQLPYLALLERLLSKKVIPTEAQELLKYQEQVADLQRQLAEAAAWRARHDPVGRMDAFGSRLESLEGVVAEVRGEIQTLTEGWEKLRRLFNDNPTA